MSSHTNNYNKNNKKNNENDTLAELDEYLKDDSNGQILAQFIQKKMGASRTKESVFAGFPMPNFNLNVKLTKCAVSTTEISNQLPLKDSNVNGNKNNAPLVSATAEISKAVVLPVEKEAVTVPTVEASTSATALAAPALLAVPQKATPTAVAVVETQRTAPVVITSEQAAIEQSPIKSMKTTTAQYVGLPTPNIPSPQAFETVPHDISPRLIMNTPRSTLRKSGSCADSLRRSAIKRRRRQLFSDFEENSINFAPIVFSTPSLGMVSGTTNNIGPSHQQNHAASYQIDREDSATNTSNVTTTSSCASNTHDLMVDLERRDVELRNIIQEMLDRTIGKVQERKNSNNNKNASIPSTQPSAAAEANHSRTYTIERGPTPGQVVLTPAAEQTVNKTSAGPVIRVRDMDTLLDKTLLMRAPLNTQTIFTIQSPIRVENVSDHNLVPETPSPKTKTLINVSTSAAAREDIEIVIPETQEVLEKTNGPAELLNQSGATSVLIRPVCCQSFYTPKRTQQQSNITVNDVETNTNTEEVAVGKTTVSSTGTQSKCNTELTNKKDILTNKSIQTTIVSNNPIDVMTDDESSDDVDVLRNNSTAPLNLAPSGSVSSRKRLRAKAKNPKRDVDCVLNLRNTHYQAEGVSRVSKKRKKIPPLNKAPNEPINGERFAMELARMTYNEIIDLRKRNSLGKVFPICGRRTSELERNKSIANQQELEQHLVREILRRDLSNRQSGTSNRRVETTIVSSQEQPLAEASMLPAPIGFEDTQRYSEVDPIGRPSTQNCRTSSRISRYIKSKEIPLTETLKNYIDAKCIIKNRRNSKRSASTKRYLYSKGDSHTENRSSSISSSSSSDGRQNEIEIVRSPPSRTFKPVEITGLVIMPPPPPFYQNGNEAMLPPPPQFGSTNEKSGEKQCDAAQEIVCNVTDNAAHKSNVLPSSTHRLSSRVSKTQSVNQEQEMEMRMETSSDAVDNYMSMQSHTSLRRLSSKGQNEVPNQMETYNNNNNNNVEDNVEDNVDTVIPQSQTRLSRSVAQSEEEQCEMEMCNIPVDQSSNQPKNKSRLKRRLTKTQSDDKLEKTEEDQKRKTLMAESMDKQEDVENNKTHKTIKRRGRKPGRKNEAKKQRTKESENFKDSLSMESLRVLTPTPPNVTEEAVPVQVELVAAHSTTASPTKNIIDDGEIASTSQAAAAKRSQSKLTAAPVINDDSVFKKPTQPPPKKTRTKKKQPAVVLEEENNTTIRRSKRGHVPLKHNWSVQMGNQSVPLFQYLYEQQMNRCMENAKKRHENETLKSRMGLSIRNAKPICASTPLYTTESLEEPNKKQSAAKPLCYGPQSITRSSSEESVDERRTRLSVISEIPAAETTPAPTKPPKAAGAKNKATKTNKTKKNQKNTNKEDDANRQENTNNEAPAATVEELINTIFNSSCEQQQEDIERQQPEEEGGARLDNAASNSVESGQKLPSSQSRNTRIELIAWLKGVTEKEAASQQSCETLEGMRISSRGNLVFTDMEGIDYAFYETEDAFSLGYMRFKPLQSRPFKRARDYILHFVVLSGEIVIATTYMDQSHFEQRTFGSGDMATINKGSRYSIKNTMPDISIVMVIKK